MTVSTGTLFYVVATYFVHLGNKYSNTTCISFRAEVLTKWTVPNKYELWPLLIMDSMYLV
jgi:hypothetical protein